MQKAIHKKETGEDLTDDQAWEMGRRLLRLYAVLLRASNNTPPTDSDQAS